MITEMKIRDRLVYTTIQINVENSSGTGFFFDLSETEGMSIPVIVTNKHVIENKTKGSLIFNIQDGSGNPLLEQKKQINFDNFESMWILHPDKSIDLCVMPIASIVKQHSDLLYSLFDFDLLMNEKWINKITAMEDVVVIGYPSGIADFHNNLPIIKKGITSTHINRSYQGKYQFLVDTGIYQGSSGSPVFLMLPFEGRDFVLSEWFYLVGIVYAVHTHPVEIQLPDGSITTTRISNGLGLAINSFVLHDFKSLVK